MTPLTPTDLGLRALPALLRVRVVNILTAPPTRSPVRRRGPAARKALAVGVVLFLAVQVALNLSVRQEWVPLRDPVYSEKLTLLQDHPAFFATPTVTNPRPVRLLALGSSRTQLAFDAARFEAEVGGVEAFNFGCPAAGPLTCALYFRRLLDAGVEPDYLLLEIHPGFITPPAPPFETRWLQPHRLRPDEPALLTELGWAVSPPEHHGPKGWVTATYAYRFAILSECAPVMLPCPFGLTTGVRSDRHGFVKGVEIPPAQRPRATARTFEQYSPVLVDYHVGGPGCTAVRETLARAARHGIRAAVVLMPESSEFRSWYGPEGYAAITTFASSLGVPVFDARTWVPDDGFADGHHLVPAGSEVYTDRLAAEVKARWLDRDNSQEKR